MVRVDGEIEEHGRASASNVISGLRQAFEYPQVKGVIVAINSPGGSPVQAGRSTTNCGGCAPSIPKTRGRRRQDMAASGGYYIAAGADQIYVDKGEPRRSIGV